MVRIFYILLILTTLHSCRIGISCSYCLNNKKLKSTFFRCDITKHQTFEKLDVLEFKKGKPFKYNIIGKISGKGQLNKRETKLTFNKKDITSWSYYQTDSLIETKDSLIFESNSWYKIKNLDNGGIFAVGNMDKVIYFNTDSKGKLKKQKRSFDPNSGGI